MHVLISHAGATGPQCRNAAAQLDLPHLTELLTALTPKPIVQGSPETLTPLSERLRADSMGLGGADGLIPWAALDARHLGLTKLHGERGWAWISPCHLSAHSDHVYMDDPQQLQISVSECETLRAAMKRYFDEDGITLHPLTPGTWLAHGEAFADLPTASLERVGGAPIDPWMPTLAGARHLRRLQNEMQMLLYTHAVNDTRSSRGLPTINGFWVSGTGTPEADTRVGKSTLELVTELRSTALADDSAQWVAQWRALDDTLILELLQRARQAKPVELTLCGQSAAAGFDLQNKPWWARVQQKFQAGGVGSLLASL